MELLLETTPEHPHKVKALMAGQCAKNSDDSRRLQKQDNI